MSLAQSLDTLAQPASTPAERFRIACDLFDEGVALQRQNLRRRFPQLPEAAIDAKLNSWLKRED